VLDGAFPLTEPLDIGRIDIEAEHRESSLSGGKRQGQADIAETDNADPRLAGSEALKQRLDIIGVIDIARVTGGHWDPQGLFADFWKEARGPSRWGANALSPDGAPVTTRREASGRWITPFQGAIFGLASGYHFSDQSLERPSRQLNQHGRKPET
jgi:hypothetical protein